MVPANVSGPMYVFITNDQPPSRTAIKLPSNMNETTNSSLVVAGPALLFVNQPDFIGSLIRPGLNATGVMATGNHTTAMSTLPMTGMRV